METYTLINLLLFFKEQQAQDYISIEAIIEIIDDDRISPSIKRDAILCILRQFGLQEEGFTDFTPKSPSGYKNRFQPYRVDQYRIPILDSVISCERILN